MAGSADATVEKVEGNTGRSVEPPTSTPVDPVDSVINCRNRIKTPGSANGSGGGDAIDFQLFTPNNKEKCIIYSEKHDCAIPDQILTDRWGTEYTIQGCPPEQLMFWYNRVASGPFDHSKSFPIFVPGGDSQEPAIKSEGGDGSVSVMPDQTVGNSGRTSAYRVLVGVQTPRVDYDADRDELRLAYGAAPTAVYSTVGQPKPIMYRRLASAPETENQPMPYTTMYIFGSPTLIMQKTICEFEAGTTPPPAAEKDDLAKGVVCDTDLPDGESESTKVYNGDLSKIGDFDDLTIVTDFIGSEQTVPGSVPSPISEMETGRRTGSTDPVTVQTPDGGGMPGTNGIGATRWMLFMNQNAAFCDAVDAARGGMLFQAGIRSGRGGKKTGGGPEISGTGKFKPGASRDNPECAGD